MKLRLLYLNGNSCTINAAQLLTHSTAVWLPDDYSHPVIFMQAYSAAQPLIHVLTYI